MEPKVIKNEAEYQAALSEVERLWDAEPGTPEGDRVETWALLIEAYESKHHAIGLPDPISAIKFRMEQADLKAKDLIPFIGSASKVSEVLSGKRSLSLNMIRALHNGLGIPAEVLVQNEAEIPEEIEGVEWSRFPIAEMCKRDWFTEFNGTLSEARQRAEELIRKMAPTLEFGELQPMKLRCKIRDGGNQDPYALFAWRVRVLSLSEEIEATDYSPGLITDDFINDLVHLSALDEGPELARQWLAKYGVRLVVERHLPKTHVDGASMWHCGHPVVALSLRYDRLDNFWFTLAHELAHFALHLPDETDQIYFDDIEHKSDDREEAEADELATNCLIPNDVWQEWIEGRKKPTPVSVRTFANKLRVHPALVAGRIRREKNDYRLYAKMVNRVSVRDVLGVTEQYT